MSSKTSGGAAHIYRRDAHAINGMAARAVPGQANNMGCKSKWVGIIAIVSGMPAVAHANDLDRPRLTFSGFGTISTVRSSESKADFTSNVLQSKGAGHSRRWSMDLDSRLGGQVIFNATPRVSAVLQLITEQRYDNSYAPTVEWANVRYQVSPDASVRVGRIALPTFLAADYRKVGYAIPWARTPSEVYNLVPISNSDGIDASYRMQLGAFRHTVQAAYGKTGFRLKREGKVDVRQLWGMSGTSEYGAATLRFSYLESKVHARFVRPLFDAYRQFGPAGQEIADRYDLDTKRVAVATVGATYDPGDWFVMAEHGWLRSRSFYGDRAAWYVSAGYRWGNVTPYLTYGKVTAESNTSDQGLRLDGLPPPLAQTAAGLNAGLNELLGAMARQRTMTAGVRLDLMNNAAVKLQYEHIRFGAGSQGLLINTQPGYRRGGSADVVSVVLDFVF
jgi:opacity protein-like surface antigen